MEQQQRTMEPTYSTLEVARRLGVSVQTIQRWVDIGRLRAWRTLGGHRRIDAEDANALFREFADEHVDTAPETDRRPWVLVVDDNELDRELAVTHVQAVLQANVAVASSGFEALLAIGRQQFDALITDLAMPHMNGFEMLRHLSLDSSRRPRFLLATSNHSADELKKMGTLPPEVTLMPKPLGPNGLEMWLAERFPQGLRPQLT
jgi:excisionase family DNA binding protein